jgi:ATP/maltotriose-dependent transcriptional regulator MalT
VPLYQAALAIARELNDPFAIGNSLDCLSDAAYRRGDLDEAERLADEAVASCRGGGSVLAAGFALSTLAQVVLARGHTARAAAAYQEALTLARNVDSDWLLADALAGCAAIAETGGDNSRAATLLGAADAIREAGSFSWLPHYLRPHQTTQAVRAALGEPSFRVAWEAGRTLPREAAIGVAQSLASGEEDSHH